MAAPAVMAEQAASEEVEDYKIDWTTQGDYTMWAPNEVKKNISVSAKDGLSVTNGTATANWMIQYLIGDNVPLSKGTDYSIKITMKGSKSGHATVAMGDWKNLALLQHLNLQTSMLFIHCLIQVFIAEKMELFLCRVVILKVLSALNL